MVEKRIFGEGRCRGSGQRLLNSRARDIVALNGVFRNQKQNKKEAIGNMNSHSAAKLAAYQLLVHTLIATPHIRNRKSLVPKKTPIYLEHATQSPIIQVEHCLYTRIHDWLPSFAVRTLVL
jgi:hypothetical protein